MTDHPKAEVAIEAFLAYMGIEQRKGLEETPRRVVNAWLEFLAGEHEDPTLHLKKTFAPENQDMVIVKQIPFFSICEHHLVPFHGHASVAYIPDDKLVGLSKIARVVKGYAARLQIQERITAQVADAVFRYLNARGVLVVITAEHLCMSMRGVKTPGALTTTSAIRGAFVADANARAEALRLIECS